MTLIAIMEINCCDTKVRTRITLHVSVILKQTAKQLRQYRYSKTVISDVFYNYLHFGDISSTGNKTVDSIIIDALYRICKFINFLRLTGKCDGGIGKPWVDKSIAEQLEYWM